MAGTSTQELKQLTVDELRQKLKKKGVTGLSAMRKDELVKKAVRTLGKDAKIRPTAKKATSRTTSASRKPSTSKASVSAKAGTSRTATSKAGTSRAGTSKASTSRAGTSKASTSKASTSKAGTSAKPSAAKPSTSRAAATTTARKPATTSRTYAQEIRSPQDRPESLGRSLITTDHDVIMRWAQERNAVPATVAGTEHEGRIGVLRLDFPGFAQAGDTSRLRQVSWDQWFRTFDDRGLNFIYQEERAGGGQSNFFRLENPQREDA